MTQTHRTLQVLLVEDNAADVELTRETLVMTGSQIELHVVRDGVQALAFLRREPPYIDAPFPDLMLLDLNLPRKDGRELLIDMRHDARLVALPVIVFTTSDAPEDIVQCYQLHANCYITKPLEPDQYINALKAIDLFWCETVRLPSVE